MKKLPLVIVMALASVTSVCQAEALLEGIAVRQQASSAYPVYVKEIPDDEFSPRVAFRLENPVQTANLPYSSLMDEYVFLGYAELGSSKLMLQTGNEEFTVNLEEPRNYLIPRKYSFALRGSEERLVVTVHAKRESGGNPEAPILMISYEFTKGPIQFMR